MGVQDTEITPEQNRRTLGDELTGLAGLIYRIANQTLDPEGMHAASLAVVYEAITLSRQIMHTDALLPHDLDDLHQAIAELQRKARHWEVSALQKQVWEALPTALRPVGPTQKAVEYALYEWLNETDWDGRDPAALAADFAAFCESQNDNPPARRNKK